jgi:hypothetical protein
MTDETQFGADYRGTSTGGAAQSAKETARQTAEQAKEAVGQAAHQAKEQVSSRLATQKDRAAESLGGVAQALRTSGQQLREQDQMGVTDYIDQIANQVERFSGYIRGHDVGELVGDVELFARRQPGLFLGGAFVLGLLGARFLKSSAPQRTPYQTGLYPYQTSRYPMARQEDSYPLYATNAEYQREVGGTPGIYDRPTRSGPTGGTEEL